MMLVTLNGDSFKMLMTESLFQRSFRYVVEPFNMKNGSTSHSFHQHKLSSTTTTKNDVA